MKYCILTLLTLIVPNFSYSSNLTEVSQIRKMIVEGYLAWETNNWEVSWEKYSPEFKKRCSKEDMVRFLSETKRNKSIKKIEISKLQVIFASNKNFGMAHYKITPIFSNKKTTTPKTRSVLLEKINGKWYINELCYPKN